LHDDVRIAWNIFRDELGNEARVEIVHAARGSTCHKPDGFALVEGSLGREASSPEHEEQSENA